MVEVNQSPQVVEDLGLVDVDMGRIKSSVRGLSSVNFIER
jgi:hypothetical protein